LSEAEHAGDARARAVRQRLAWLCRHASLHVRFLNTLSLLEHIGSRKIMNSRPADGLSGDVMRHLAEETRHAYFFKRAAENLARRPLGYGVAETMAGAAARAYIGRLDASVTRECNEFAGSTLPYLYMSLVVELRAVWFYRLYRDVLDAQGIGIALRSVLAEEELHLGAMFERLGEMDPHRTPRLVRFKALEEQRFYILWNAVEAECSRRLLAAE
jgi:hypothetical protein